MDRCLVQHTCVQTHFKDIYYLTLIFHQSQDSHRRIEGNLKITLYYYSHNKDNLNKCMFIQVPAHSQTPGTTGTGSGAPRVPGTRRGTPSTRRTGSSPSAAARRRTPCRGGRRRCWPPGTWRCSGESLRKWRRCCSSSCRRFPRGEHKQYSRIDNKKCLFNASSRETRKILR